MEEEEDKSCEELEITVEDIRGRVYLAKIKQIQEETQMQWMWTKEEKKTELVTCVESRCKGNQSGTL